MKRGILAALLACGTALAALALVFIAARAMFWHTIQSPSPSEVAARATASAAPIPPAPPALEYHVVSIEPQGTKYQRVNVEVRNAGNRSVRFLEVTCLGQDGGGRTYSFQRLYVVGKEGIAPGASAFKSYLLTTGQRPASVRFQLDSYEH